MSLQCQCGRDAVKIHCPRCGSFACYARRGLAQPLKISDGVVTSVVEDMNYVCRKCGLTFFNSNRASCAAPKSNITGRARTVDSRINPDLIGKPDAERMAWAKAQLSKLKRSE